MNDVQSLNSRPPVFRKSYFTLKKQDLIQRYRDLFLLISKDIVNKSCRVRISELFSVGPKSNIISNTDGWFILYGIMYCHYRLEKTDNFDGNHGNRSGHCWRGTDSFDGPVGKMYKTFDHSCVCEDVSSLFHLVCGWVFWKSMEIICF